MKILMVCLGNICRSPIAEGVMSALVHQHGLDWQVHSAGTSGFHNGEPPHRDSIAICAKHDISITHQRSQQLTSQDFYTYDYILVMDHSNLDNARDIAPVNAKATLELLLSYHPNPQSLDVPDPYYTGGFDLVYDQIAVACRHFVAQHSPS